MDFFTVQIISNTDLQLGQCIEDIKFGQGDTGNTTHLDCLADHDRIEPSAPAAPARDRPKFIPPFSKYLACLVR